MQNRYAGDVGDFGKYGLLRAICADDLQLAVLWYLVPDEGHNADGKHVGYLAPQKAHDFRPCDPPLFDAMRAVAASTRSVEAVRRSGVLERAAFHDQPLAFAQGESRAERLLRRRRWLAGARAVARRADVVFFDPDNGLETPSVALTAAKGPKFLAISDLAELTTPEQSLVIYHHTSRSTDARTQAREALRRVTRVRGASDSAFAMLFRRGSVRAFLVVPAPRHARRLAERCAAMIASPWGAHFELVGPRRHHPRR